MELILVDVSGATAGEEAERLLDAMGEQNMAGVWVNCGKRI